MVDRNSTAASPDDDEFLERIHKDIDERRKQDEESRRLLAERGRLQAEFERVLELLKAVEIGAPRNGYGLDDEPPPFSSKAWAGLIVDAAKAWHVYHANFGKLARPEVSDEYGHEAAYRIFCRALDTGDPGAVAALIDKLLPPFRLIGKKVHTKANRFHEGISGLADYFHLVAFEFGRRQGNLWQYEGEYLPGRITVGRLPDGSIGRLPHPRKQRPIASQLAPHTSVATVAPAPSTPATPAAPGVAAAPTSPLMAQKVVIQESKRSRTVRRFVEGHEVDQAIIRGPSQTRLFDIVVGARGQHLSWAAIRSAWMNAVGWKGRVVSESSIRDYALRIKRNLDEQGLRRFWRYSSEGVSWGG